MEKKLKLLVDKDEKDEKERLMTKTIRGVKRAMARAGITMPQKKTQVMSGQFAMESDAENMMDGSTVVVRRGQKVVVLDMLCAAARIEVGPVVVKLTKN